MPNDNSLNRPAYGCDKRADESPAVLTYEIWENFLPQNLIAGEKLVYHSDILSEEQLKIMIPFWLKLGSELSDPVLSLQYDKNGGSTILYRYSDEREGVPPNARGRVIKPIFDKGIVKVVLSDYSRYTFVLHATLNSPTLKDEVSQFLLMVENNSYSDEIQKERYIQNDILANTFILDSRINKIESHEK